MAQISIIHRALSITFNQRAEAVGFLAFGSAVAVTVTVTIPVTILASVSQYESGAILSRGKYNYCWTSLISKCKRKCHINIHVSVVQL